MKNAVKLIFSTFLILILLLSYFSVIAGAEDVYVTLTVNGENLPVDANAFIRDGITYASVKALSAAFSLNCKMFLSHGSATIYDYTHAVCFTIGENYATVSELNGESDEEYYYYELSATLILDKDTLFVPVRDFTNVFGFFVDYDKKNKEVILKRSSVFSAADFECGVYSQIPDGTIYYFQNQQDFQLPGYGSGYCWVCSYAMLLTAVTGNQVLPNDVAAVNLEHTSQGNYCYHSQIAERFNVSFVPALSKDSVFYSGMDSVSGGTFIKNPDKEDKVAIAAIKQALLKHPEGVLVRYAAFPHTMVAIGFTDDVIYFNDPAPTSSSSYSSSGKYQGVPFERTCVAAKGFKISDLTFIQAVEEK